MLSPQQGLWTVLAVVKSSSRDRASKGLTCLQKITVSFYVYISCPNVTEPK